MSHHVHFLSIVILPKEKKRDPAIPRWRGAHHECYPEMSLEDQITGLQTNLVVSASRMLCGTWAHFMNILEKEQVADVPDVAQSHQCKESRLEVRGSLNQT